MEETGWFAVDTPGRPRYVDGFSFLHLSYGVIREPPRARWGFPPPLGLWSARGAVGNPGKHVRAPHQAAVRASGDAVDTVQNMAGDVVVAVAGTGLAVAVPAKDLGLGLGIFAAGVVWSVARAHRKPTPTGSSLL